jgi:hypothetical protein
VRRLSPVFFQADAHKYRIFAKFKWNLPDHRRGKSSPRKVDRSMVGALHPQRPGSDRVAERERTGRPADFIGIVMHHPGSISLRATASSRIKIWRRSKVFVRLLPGALAQITPTESPRTCS